MAYRDTYSDSFKTHFLESSAPQNVPKLADNKVAFITTTRDEIVQMTQTLISAIETRFLIDPKNPVLVSVIGGYQTGKKLIADTGHETLLHEGAALKGVPNTDEYRCGFHNGHMIEVDFINLLSTDYSDPKLEPPSGFLGFFWTRIWGEKGIQNRVLEKFITKRDNERQHGGLSFVHNGGLSRIKADIEIFLQSPHDAHERIGDTGRLSNHPHLRPAFYGFTSMASPEWVRLVEVTVKNPALMQSEQFAGAFKKLPTQTLG